MARYLAVVERAYRGTVEEQYAHILWLCRVLSKMRGQIGILLSGNAVLYAQRQQRTPVLCIGELALAHLPQYSTTITELIADGVSVYVTAEDVRRLQLDSGDICPGVTLVSEAELPELYLAYNGCWYW